MVRLALLLLAACGGEGDHAAVDAAGLDAGRLDAGQDANADTDAEAELDATVDAAVDAGADECPREPAPADRLRRVLVSHPYDDLGAPVARWEVLSLDGEGVLSTTGESFAMGRAVFGTVAWTPDGLVAAAPLEDGTIGVVSFAGGAADVGAGPVAGAFYAGALVVGPDGDVLWILDPNWRKNGGGVYRAAIGCDGSIAEPVLVAEGRGIAALDFVADDRALVAAHDVLDSAPGDDAHLLDVSAVAVVAGGVDAFGDDEAIVSSAALSDDGVHWLIGDGNAFSGIPNRVAVVRVLDDGGLEAVGRVDVEDPVAIATRGDVVLVASGFGDAIHVFDLDPDVPEAPLQPRGELEYVGARPALPGAAVSIERGSLQGLVLFAENLGVRTVRIEEDGEVVDHGLTALGEGTAAIVGAVGLEP